MCYQYFQLITPTNTYNAVKTAISPTDLSNVPRNYVALRLCRNFVKIIGNKMILYAQSEVLKATSTASIFHVIGAELWEKIAKPTGN